jgi:hypothetical protein
LEIRVVMAWGSTVDDVESGVVRALDDATVLASLFIDDVSSEDRREPECAHEHAS